MELTRPLQQASNDRSNLSYPGQYEVKITCMLVSGLHRLRTGCLRQEVCSLHQIQNERSALALLKSRDFGNVQVERRCDHHNRLEAGLLPTGGRSGTSRHSPQDPKSSTKDQSRQILPGAWIREAEERRIIKALLIQQMEWVCQMRQLIDGKRTVWVHLEGLRMGYQVT